MHSSLTEPPCPSLAPCLPQTKKCLALSEASCYTQGLEEPGNSLENEDQSKNAVLNLVRSGLLCHLASSPHFPSCPFSTGVYAEAFSTTLPISGLQEESQTHWTPNILHCAANGNIKLPLLEDFTSVSFPQILVK